jgi:hypothetical protein
VARGACRMPCECGWLHGWQRGGLLLTLLLLLLLLLLL